MVQNWHYIGGLDWHRTRVGFLMNDGLVEDYQIGIGLSDWHQIGPGLVDRQIGPLADDCR